MSDAEDAAPPSWLEPGVDAPPQGRYQVLEILGAGAFGRVVRALDRELHRQVAIKILIRSDKDPTAGERFLREGRLTSRIRHPHIVEVYDFGLDGHGNPFVVYELVPGTDLLKRAVEGYEHLDLLRWGTEICGALQAVHEAGAVHRDVKPANVLITTDGRALLADFGLARLEGELASLTRTGHVVGTPAYLPPDVWRGAPAGPATDQWAWAASLFAALYGAPPYGAAEIGRILQAAEADLPVVIPEEHQGRHPRLERVLRRALRTRAEGRYPDMTAFGAALAQCADEEPEVAAAGRTAPLGGATASRVAPPAPTASGVARPLRAASSSGPLAGASGSPAPRRRAGVLVVLAVVGLVVVVLARGGLAGGPVGPAAAPLPDPAPIREALARLLPDHDLGDGSPAGYETHLAQIRPDLEDSRFALRYRRLLEAMATWAEEVPVGDAAGLAAADRLLDVEIRPVVAHLTMDWGMLIELENSESLGTQLGTSSRGATAEEIATLQARRQELGAATMVLLPRLGVLAAMDRAPSLGLRAELSGLFGVGPRSEILTKVLELQATLEDPEARMQLLLSGIDCVPGSFGLQAGDCARRKQLLGALVERLRAAQAGLPASLRARLAGRAITHFHPFLSRCESDPDGLITDLFEAAADTFERSAGEAPELAEVYLRWFELNDSVILGTPAPKDPARWRDVTLRLRRIRGELPGAGRRARAG